MMNIGMVAYATYPDDARIKSYIKTIEENGGRVDLLLLKHNNKSGLEKIGRSRIYYTMKKYVGKNPTGYILSYLMFFIISFFRLSILFLKNRYSVIHFHNMPNFIVFAGLLPKFLRSKIILDVHDLMPAIYMVRFGVEKRHFLIKALKWEQQISARFADCVICADHFQKEELKGYDIPGKKITVLMNIPNDQLFNRKRLKNNNSKFNIIYHGTIAKRLGIDILLQAIFLVKDKIPIFLSIYGKGEFLEECLQLRDKLGLNEQVYFSESFFPFERIPELVTNMDLGVVPNRKNIATDNFMMPVKLLEYVYLGLPVIAPRLKIIEYYFDETMVKFFQPENVNDLVKCLFELYKNTEERKRLAKNALKFYEKNNCKKMEKEYLSLIQ